MTRIIVWSGGPDSTYELKRALEETEDPVVAVTMHVAQDNPRLRICQANSTRRIARQLQQIRPFEHIVYSISAEQLRHRNKDAELHFCAMMVAFRYTDPVIYWGMCADDPTGYNIANVPELVAVVAAVAPDVEANIELPKAEIRKRLGPLWDLTTSCIAPRHDLAPCGQCKKCRERGRAES